MPVLSSLPPERHGFDHRFANDDDHVRLAAVARDIAPGERWAFVEHRTMAEVIAVERLP